MRVLVCGGAGYIGSNMTGLLAAEGHEPVVYDNLSMGHKSAIGQARAVRGDLDDYESLVDTLRKLRLNFDIEWIHISKWFDLRIKWQDTYLTYLMVEWI